MSRTWVRWLKQRRRETGSIEPGRPTGRPRKIDRDKLAALVKQFPDATLVELRDKLGIECSPTAIWMALHAMRITFKNKRCGPPSEIARMLRKDARNGGRGKSDSIRSGSFSSMKRGRTRR